MKRIHLIVLAGAALAGAATAAGAADPAAGKAKAGLCAACHGQNGVSTADIYPNLACQKEKYLLKSLEAYKSGARNDPVMKPMAMPLSPDDMRNLAAYYAQLGC